MRVFTFLFCMLCAGGAIAGSAVETPRVLIDAVSCLAATNQVSMRNSGKFAYIVDNESYPGERVMYVVNYTKSLTSGYVFVIFLHKDKHQTIFKVENNATFVIRETEPSEVLFSNPPLGGGWARQHIIAAIRKASAARKYYVDASEMHGATAGAVCKSYAE